MEEIEKLVPSNNMSLNSLVTKSISKEASLLDLLSMIDKLPLMKLCLILTFATLISAIICIVSIILDKRKQKLVQNKEYYESDNCYNCNQFRKYQKTSLQIDQNDNLNDLRYYFC